MATRAAPLVSIYVGTIEATHEGMVSELFLQAVSCESALPRFEGIFNAQEHRPFGYVCNDQGTLVGFAVVDVP